ncbi:MULTISPECIES: nucleoside deaminase [Glutamicibacter]|uniref:Nucleoside deaminase n=1 Tax=Glutamicibacter halophytocola TaxID=1933880 RepID=A0A5B8I350_9MICC|nr:MULTISPECIES: nucleoside deaminase [Glutamicibacter]ALG30161.1 cytosine deaminase [Glutamicibacter halophytocola]MBF6670664.1 nucleoside deaminase [Glutamicibacter sp. FBE19]QDY66436.1 nucleoside deaminase [Glutamicibacter halophytocola]UUX58542.1 nucleoside deaminase [Glutamicibacter halophytocola]
MSVNTTGQDYLSMAIEIATQNVHNAGGPFGAIVVTPDGQVFEGVNRVTASNDPSAHAEVVAIRTAAAALENFDLSGCVLYTSCEPCPMCLATSLWARISKVCYAADRHDAAKAGFDDAVFYEYFEADSDRALMPVQHFDNDAVEHLKPFEAWDALETRTDY